jgi:hypothetical protein
VGRTTTVPAVGRLYDSLSDAVAPAHWPPQFELVAKAFFAELERKFLQVCLTSGAEPWRFLFSRGAVRKLPCRVGMKGMDRTFSWFAWSALLAGEGRSQSSATAVGRKLAR